MIFRDRLHAAKLLVERLRGLTQGKRPLVLGIPRGSVPMASAIAKELDGDLDVVLVHKIGAPFNPEFAIGSVSEFGTVHVSEESSIFGSPATEIQEQAAEELQKLRRKRQAYSPIRPPIDPVGRTVIIVDDGIATGATMLAAVEAVRSQKPERIIVASPVASPRILEKLRTQVDETVVLQAPEDFMAISEFYEDFSQVTDEEVFALLKKSGPHPAAKAA